MSTIELTSHPLPRVATARAHRSAVESVLARMRQSSDAPLRLAEMAEVAGVSRCHFDRLFRSVTGLSPLQFQTALRLHTATRLLLTTDRSVTDICFDIGYESLGSFVTKFTSTFGLPPQRLRQIATRFDQPVGEMVGGWRLAVAGSVGARQVTGEVEAQGFDGAVFVGLFRQRIPEESPAACAILLQPGSFAMTSPIDGRYHAMAIGMRPEQRAIEVLLDDAIPRAASAHPLLVRRGATNESIHLVLRGPESIDPPVNLTLPLLLAATRGSATVKRAGTVGTATACCVLLVMMVACGAPQQESRTTSRSSTTVSVAVDDTTPEDPPYAANSVFKPETHRGTPAPPTADTRLVSGALVANDGGEAYAHLGESVSIDGNIAVAGAPYAEAGTKTDAGAAYVFVRADNRWRTATRLAPPQAVAYDRFGASVAVSGETIAVASDRHDRFANDGGAVFVFARDGGGWRHEATLAPRTLQTSATFGYSTALDGDTLVAGAPGASAVYVFVRRGGKWIEQTQLRPPATLRYSGFGHAVAIDGDVIVIGANTTSEPLLLGGSAYVFRRKENSWQLEASLRSPRDEALARFGTATAIRGDVALIGASRATVGTSTRAGAAFVFERRGGAWTAVAELTDDPPRSDEEFGRALALLSDVAVVGSQFGDAVGLNTGGAQLYVREHGQWKRTAALLAKDRATISEFAFAIAASDRDVIIGAPRRNTNATATGSAYIFPVAE